jgi:TonB family protein
MTAALLLYLALSLPEGTTAIQDVPLSFEERITRLDNTLKGLREVRAKTSAATREPLHDLRGRTFVEDVEQWAFTPERLKRAEELLVQARVPGSATGPKALDEADAVMYEAFGRYQEIDLYWDEVQEIPWRERWKAFATANGRSLESFNLKAIVEEDRLRDTLKAGNFLQAVAQARGIEELLQNAISAATTEIVRSRKPEDVVFVSRSTPCPAALSPSTDSKAKLTEASDPESWYPDAARKRGENGAIVVRARIAETGCATHFGVLVGSGYPELDAAALKVAEASRYQAATNAQGKPYASDLHFKVRFEIKVEEPAEAGR